VEPSESSQPTNTTNFTIIGLIVGGVLGYPLSYYFQPDVLQAKISLGSYIQHFSDVIGDKDLQSAVVLGFVVAIVVCTAAGFMIDRAQR